MPINPIVLQRRHAELGRIRLGNKVGDGRGRPNKLDRFRFTSASERYITDLANLYGGTARQWDNNGVPQWEVITDAQTVPVIAVRNGLTQWMETWSGGGCVHRCDGITNQLTGEACNPDDKAHIDAKPTTRLSVMLPELEAVGVWRMESHGWNSAAEIPAVAELATFVGDLVPAHLHLQERRAIKDGKTSRFVVPVLDLQIGAARLREIASAKAAGVALPAASGQQQALEGGRPQIEGGAADAFAPFFDRLAAAASFEECQQVWSAARAAGLVGEGSAASARRDEFFTAIKRRGEELKDSPAAEPAQQPDADGVYDAQVVDDDSDDPEPVWQQVLKTAGEQGMTTSQVFEDYSQWSQGEQAGDATAGQLREYLKSISPPSEGVASGITSRPTATAGAR